MKTYQKLAIALSLGLSLMGCGGVGTEEDPASLPVAVDDTATANITQKAPTVIPVLENDKPQDQLDPTTVEIITPPEHGISSISSSTGEVKYEPNSSYTDTDSFIYTVKDKKGNYSNPATVTITSSQLPFKITVKTNNVGVSNDNEFTIPIVGGSYDINCGDSTTTNGTAINGSFTCQYPSAGTYTISITGDIPQISFFSDGTDIKDNLKLLSIDQWGNGQWTSMKDAFFNCSKLKLNTPDSPNLTNVTDMSRMFFHASVFNGDISNWEVGTVKFMDSMFTGAKKFNGDLGAWDVSSVKNMFLMFGDAQEFEGINLASWKHRVSNVTNMGHMFTGANAFNGNLGDWDVSSVTNMQGMFRDTNSFTGKGISLWADKVSKVVSMDYMFSNAISFNENIENWNVSSVTNMKAMFKGAIAFDQSLFSWSVKEVLDMSHMFESSGFDGNIADWDIRNVADMTDMLLGSQLSTENYDNLLGGWGVRPLPNGLKPGVFFSVGDTKHSAGTLALKNSIVTNYGWIITDGGCVGAGCP